MSIFGAHDNIGSADEFGPCFTRKDVPSVESEINAASKDATPEARQQHDTLLKTIEKEVDRAEPVSTSSEAVGDQDFVAQATGVAADNDKSKVRTRGSSKMISCLWLTCSQPVKPCRTTRLQWLKRFAQLHRKRTLNPFKRTLYSCQRSSPSYPRSRASLCTKSSRP